MNNLKFIQEFNLMIKSLSMAEEIPTKQRRLIIKTLVDLGYIKQKVKKDEIINILYKIKDKLIKGFDNNIKNIEVKTENIKVGG